MVFKVWEPCKLTFPYQAIQATSQLPQDTTLRYSFAAAESKRHGAALPLGCCNWHVSQAAVHDLGVLAAGAASSVRLPGARCDGAQLRHQAEGTAAAATGQCVGQPSCWDTLAPLHHAPACVLLLYLCICTVPGNVPGSGPGSMSRAHVSRGKQQLCMNRAAPGACNQVLATSCARSLSSCWGLHTW